MRSNKFKFLEKKHDGGDWRITSPFGRRRNPITGISGQFHGGIDISTYAFTRVYAPFDGMITVNQLANDTAAGGAKAGGGYIVYLQRSNGDRIELLHLLEVSPFVKVGQRVKQGDLLCQTGRTGASTAAHLHIYMRVNGQLIDPVPYLTEIGMLNLESV